MATGSKINAQGTVITFNSEIIGNVLSFSGFDGTVTQIDTTTLASTAMEYDPGLEDNGEFSVDVFRDPLDDGQAECKVSRDTSVKYELKVTYADGSSDTAASAFVTSFNSTGAKNEKVMATITFKISGAVVYDDGVA